MNPETILNWILIMPVKFVLSAFVVWIVYDYVALLFPFLPRELNFFEIMATMLVIKLVKA